MKEFCVNDSKEIRSAEIRAAIGIAIGSGNAIKIVSTDWKPKCVVFMVQPLSSEIVDAIKRACPELRHSITEATPHNPATECFTDTANNIVVAFPARGEARRWY
jgi:hypothetical protein